MIKKILDLSRFYKYLILVFFDSIAILLALIMSFLVRSGYWYFPEKNLMLLIMVAPFIAIPIFMYFGLYKAIIRHIGFNAIWDVVKAVSLYALVWGIIGLLAAFEGMPRSVVLINFALSIIAIISLRAFVYFVSNRSFKLNTKQKKSLVYGAGDAGIQLVSALEKSSESNPVGFIDDALELQGHYIRGLNVYAMNDIDKIINKFDVDEILVAMPSVSRNKRLDIISQIESYPVNVRVLPGLAELVEGNVEVSDLREVSINDLLGREAVAPNSKLLGKNITNNSVLVTGAGGSIGSELCRQIILLNPKFIILYEISELALYKIQNELSNINSNNIDIYPILGSVNNKSRMSLVCKIFNVDTIYHTAAINMFQW